MAQATISRVTLNTKNGRQIVLALSNGEVKFYPENYILKLLEGNFLSDARPTILVGATCSYEKVNYKAGDMSVDDKGVASTVKHTKDGSKLIKFEIDMTTVGQTVSEYDKARMQANAVAQATVKLGSAFGIKPKAEVAAPQEQVPAGESSEETI